MKVLVNSGIDGISFKDNVTKVAVNLGFCRRIESLINGEGVEMTDFQEYSLEEILDFYEISFPVTLSDLEDLLYAEVKYSIENDTYAECYFTNQLDQLFYDIFTEMKNDSLVIDTGFKYKIYNSDGKVISED